MVKYPWPVIPTPLKMWQKGNRKMKQMLFPGFFGGKTEEDPQGYIFVRFVKRKDGRIIWPRKGSVLRIPRSSLKRVA